MLVVLSRSRRTVLFLGALIAVTITAGCGGEPAELVGYEVDPAREVGSLELTDTTTGDVVPVRAADGEYLAVFLGFTNCPDACPLAMAELGVALDRLDERAGRIGVAMITVDPRRDTADALTDYVRGFTPAAIGLRTEDESCLRTVSEAFGATFAASHDDHGDTLEVGHTDQTYLVDDTGTVVLTWTADMTAEDIYSDLGIMLDRQR